MRNNSPERDGPSAVEVLAANDCWDLLRAVSVGHLAVLVDGHPEIFPVNYKVDHGSVVFRTGEGTKLHAASQPTAVALEADGTDQDKRTAWSVQLKGHAEVLEPSPELMAGVGLTLFPWQAGHKDHFVRIIPTAVSGRRFTVASPLTWWSHLEVPTRAGLA
ncbi:pyridoxamine 5'-phosphate oxidase family protein [Pseudarthrobacter polychromogenes]|uniref:Pyridoxamine 5'-phosphate oxidase n=1 Tax=Pseudarthrobacter polychromogenes TaxID=1676 RepID=A0ABQ1XCH1_9MICC|nr:pyridoxamine 5'-phosphate oxidase family protein [Pseudarthrobacter polychromogenes]MBD1592205.1 pyridoxamine 5'-phosphate oxidase family protein [Arthrobacter sp. S1_S22]GGG84800.1 pyridoxamine 5'-phosphate oxidase [Pseudarthrobacter polychromogenes]